MNAKPVRSSLGTEPNGSAPLCTVPKNPGNILEFHCKIRVATRLHCCEPLQREYRIQIIGF